MVDFSRFESSKSLKKDPGCIWGLLEFFNLRQRLKMKKMLSYQKRGDPKAQSHDRIYIQTPAEKYLSTGQEPLLDRVADNQMETKVDTAKKSSGKHRLLTYLYGKLTKKRDRKRKISPSASQLLRTISIHHLESDEYVLPDETTSGIDSLIVELESHVTDFPVSSEHIMMSPKDDEGTSFGNQKQIDETVDSANTLSTYAKMFGRNIAHQSGDDTEVFSANKKLHFGVLQDGSPVLADNSLALQPSSEKLVLAKSTSFPGAGFSGRSGGLYKNLYSSPKRELKSQSENSRSFLETTSNFSQDVGSWAGDKVHILKPNPATVNNLRIDSGDGKTVLKRLKDLKQRILDGVKNNRKDIAMDGVLDKVPLGHKLPEDVEKEQPSLLDRDRFRSKSGRDGFVYANSKLAHRGIQRSRSLTESLDRHSHLLNSISAGELIQVPERSKSIKEDGSLARKRILRSHSLTESMDRYSRLFESILVTEPKMLPEVLKSIKEDGGLQDRKSPKTLVRMLSSPEIRSYSSSNDDEGDVSLAAPPSEGASGLSDSNAAADTYCSNEQKVIGDSVSSEETLESDEIAQHTVELDTTCTMGGLEQPTFISEHERNESCSTSDDIIAEDSNILMNEEKKTETHPINKPSKPSPVSILDSDFEEHAVSPAKYANSEDAELQPDYIHFEELEDLANPENQLGNGEPKEMELTKEDFDMEQLSGKTTKSESLHVGVDRKKEAVLRYVRDVLSYVLNGEVEDFLGEYPSLFVEGECSPHELEATRYDSFDILLDQQLLYDLINEVLLEICENSIARSMKLSQFEPCLRPVSVEKLVLEDVWAKISWQLSLQQDMNQEYDYIVARDFAKNDKWMKLHKDSEKVGIKMEDLILDNLLDEIVLEMGIV